MIIKNFTWLIKCTCFCLSKLIFKHLCIKWMQSKLALFNTNNNLSQETMKTVRPPTETQISSRGNRTENTKPYHPHYFLIDKWLSGKYNSKAPQQSQHGKKVLANSRSSRYPTLIWITPLEFKKVFSRTTQTPTISVWPPATADNCHQYFKHTVTAGHDLMQLRKKKI